jgi:type III pantothenate kinase
MLLAIDIGNTNVGVGVFSESSLVARWRLSTRRLRTADEYAVTFESLFRLATVDPGQIDAAILSSVVPAASGALRDALGMYWNIDSIAVTSELDVGMDLRYTPPTSLGTDRIAGALAGIEIYGCPAVIVDLGTATTFDAVSRDRAFLGGAIAPGLRIAQGALSAHTSQLPVVPLDPPPSAIGSSTVLGLQSGVLYGYAGLVDGLVRRMQLELGDGVRVIATGGLAHTVAPLSETVQHVDVDLTLIGLRLLYERNT